MNLDRASLQTYVNETRESIINHSDVWVESIRVHKDRTIGGSMETETGIIFYNPEKLTTRNVEYALLHELGHRLHEQVDPEVNLSGNYSMIGNLVGNALEIFSEGIANCFSMEVFPKWLDVSKETNEIIKLRRKKLMDILEDKDNSNHDEAHEYVLANEIYVREEFDGLDDYCTQRRMEIETQIRKQFEK